MTSYSRRTFFQTAGLGAGASMLLPAFTNPVRENRRVNVALCGLGRYAMVLKKGFTESQYCRLAGIVTGTPAKAAQWQKDYALPDKNVYSYQTFDQLATNPAIDLIYITLPNGLHKEYTIRAAQAGKHVIVEKPIAFTVRDCQEMIAACRKAGGAVGRGLPAALRTAPP